MLEKQYVTRAEWKKHTQTHPLVAHGIWPILKKYVPGWGYSKDEIDDMWEGYTPAGKGKVHWDSITNKPSTYPPSSHTHPGSDITSAVAEANQLTVGSYHLNSLIANNKVPDSDMLDGQHGSYYAPASHSHAHGDLTGVTYDQHHAKLHAATHHLSGADELNHDNLAGFVGNEHIDWTNASQLLKTSGGIQTAIFMAYGTAASGNALYRLKPYGTDDDSFVRWLDKDGYDEWSIGTQSHQASWIVRRESGTPQNCLIVDRTTGKVTAAVELDTSKVTIGAYYLNSLIANNKVPDSDTVDGIHGTAFVRGDGIDSGGKAIRIDDADFKVYDGTDTSPTEYIFRDWSEGRLYIGTAAALVYFRSDVRINGNKLYFSTGYLDDVVANNKVPDSDKLDGQHGSYYAPTTTKLDDWGVPDDNTDLNATTSRHGLLPKLSGSTSQFLRGDGSWGAPQVGAHAATHHSGGGDEVNHDSLVGFVGNEHIDWTDASQMLLTSGGVQTGIFMAYGSNPIYRLKPSGTEDDSFVRWLDTGGLNRWSIGTESHQGSFVIRRESGTPGNVVVVEPGGGVLIPTEVDTGKLTIGSYYLNSLIANNKVPDSDKWDGYQFANYLDSDNPVKKTSNPTFNSLYLYDSGLRLQKSTSLYVTTPYGYIQIGPQNSSWCHIYSGFNFYFNQPIYISGTAVALVNRKLDDFGTPDDNTDLNASTSRHGLLMKLSGGTTQFLRGDGTWQVPPTGGGGDIHYSCTPQSLSLTIDNTWRDMDVTAYTSANAKFAILMLKGSTTSTYGGDLMVREKGETNPCGEVTLNGDSEHDTDENNNVIVPLDSSQVFQYKAFRQNATVGFSLKIVGWIE